MLQFPIDLDFLVSTLNLLKNRREKGDRKLKSGNKRLLYFVSKAAGILKLSSFFSIPRAALDLYYFLDEKNTFTGGEISKNS